MLNKYTNSITKYISMFFFHSFSFSFHSFSRLYPLICCIYQTNSFIFFFIIRNVMIEHRQNGFEYHFHKCLCLSLCTLHSKSCFRIFELNPFFIDFPHEKKLSLTILCVFCVLLNYAK